MPCMQNRTNTMKSLRIIAAALLLTLIAWVPADASVWSQFFSPVKSMQSFTATFTTASGGTTVTISAVNTAKAVIIPQGYGSGASSNSTTAGDVNAALPNFVLTNGTTITISPGTSGLFVSQTITVKGTVIEYN